MRKLINYILGDKAFLLITPLGFNRGNWSVLKKNTISQFIGTYEKNLLPHLVSNTKKIINSNNRPVIFDIGSSYGYYSTFFSKFKKCKVVAFEPDIDAFKVLKKIKNKRDNLFLENSEINEDKMNAMNFQAAVDKYGKPNLIKIDIEGYEERLLLNNLNYFKDNETVIILEVHSIEIENNLKTAFKKIGYKIDIIDNDLNTLRIRKVVHNRWLILNNTNIY